MDDFPWDAPVGRFVLAFGDIEHTTVALLGCLPDCRIPRNATRLTLGQRFELLREVLPRYAGQEYQATLASMEAAARLTDKRNLVAHNTVWIDIFQKDDGWHLTDHLISSRNRGNRLTLEEMRALADDARAAAFRFSQDALQVLQLHVEN